MPLKIPVTDRIPTYPGRVKLTPVSGRVNVYTMERADDPTNVGTPINKALLDNKAYTLVESVSVYVNGNTGNDTTADGSVSKPYRTIQAAIDSIPKCLGGFVATVEIASGSYLERVRIEGFYGGRLIVGTADQTVVVNGVSIFASSSVQLRISTITAGSGDSATLLYVGAGSNVLIGRHLTVNCENITNVGIGVEQNSSVSALGVSLNVHKSVDTAMRANHGARIYAEIAGGSNNAGIGLRADNGSTITYGTRSLAAATVQLTTNGGRIYSGGQTSVPNY